MPHIFVSYKHADEAFIHELEATLEKQGFEVWTDQELPAGEDWKEAIDQAIRNAYAVLVVITPAAAQSEYVTYEWSYAWGKGIKIIPLLREPTTMHPRLATLQHIDFTSPGSAVWNKLLRRLQQIEGEVLLQQLEHSQWRLRLGAVRRLGTLQNKKAVPRLIHMMRKDRSKKVRVAAEEALEKIGTEEALAAVEELWSKRR